MREPSNDEARLMIVGGFETLEEYLEWMNTPLPADVLAKLEEPDLEEEIIEEMIEDGEWPTDDDDPEEEAEHERMMEAEYEREMPGENHPPQPL